MVLVGALQSTTAIHYFKREGRFAELMEPIPIHVVQNHAALVGVAD